MQISRSQLQKGVQLETGTSVDLILTTSPAICTRITGLHFETDKTFLLPNAIPNLKALTQVFERSPEGEILIVGHTDTTGANDYNRKLSVERARNFEAFLRDDPQVWLKNYKSPSAGDAWGTREDQLMLSSLGNDGIPFYTGLIDGDSGAETKKAISNFQESVELESTGFMNDNSRELLIKAYMAADNTSISEQRITLIHGCGEEHPLVETSDNVDEQKNRRVEVFLFPFETTPLPVDCAIPGGCDEYQKWLDQVTETIIIDDSDPDVVDNFKVEKRSLTRPQKEEHVTFEEDGKRVTIVTFLHLPDASENFNGFPSV